MANQILTQSPPFHNQTIEFILPDGPRSILLTHRGQLRILEVAQ